MTEQQAVNRFILMNLLRIGATVVVLLAILLWQTDIFVTGGSILGFPIAIAALVVSFFGPKWLAGRWHTPARAVKRFYKAAAAGDDNRILLDGRPVKTPGRADLAPPSAALAAAIAEEWNAQVETIDPHEMRMTGLANAAIDRIAPDKAAFADGLAAYGESDLLYYRADGPAALVARQADAWDPVLAWARRRYDVDFVPTRGVIHQPQPPNTIAQLAQAVHARDAFELAGLSPLVTVGGSLILALALAEGAIGLDEAWAAATVDEAWHAERWGEDAEAAKTLALRRADFEAAHRFLGLL